jgi:hypothetical protein
VVCLDNTDNDSTVARAETTDWRMLGDADVDLEWRDSARSCRTAGPRTVAAPARIAAQAGDGAPAAQMSVTVCVDSSASPRVLARSEAIASGMYARIGVRIDWRKGFRGCPPQGIQIVVSSLTPPTLMPGSVAYAMPYEGVHVRVFYDRISGHSFDLVPPLLAHVLAHEIGHILQRIHRHSDEGVMKARWDDDDYDRMIREPLEFTSHDIELIRQGLALRAAAR